MWSSPAPAWKKYAAPQQLQIRDYTVGWICALPIELAAAQEMLDVIHEPIVDHNDTLLYTLGRIYGHNVVIACLPAGTTGTQSAATVAARMRSRFTNIKFGLMIGIGGGVPTVELDIRLGDVVVSHPYQQHGGVVQYDFGKTIAKGHMRTGWLNAPPPVLLSAIVEQRARHFRRQSTLESHLARFDRPGLELFTRKSVGHDWLFNATYEHPGGSDCRNCSNVEKVQRAGLPPGITLHYGTIASGNQVMRDGVKRDEISKELGGVMCFEMEAAGLMNDFPCLVIRGICDYADSHKNKTWQPYAAATAAACAKEILTIVPALPQPESVPLGQSFGSGQARVEMKLDLLMRELNLGYRTRGQLVKDIKKDLIDDNVTEVDVEENREFIDEWLKSTEADGWHDASVPGGPHASVEREKQPHYHDQNTIPRQNNPPQYQARCDEGSDDDDDKLSDRDDYYLSDAETEVADDQRVPGDITNETPAKLRLTSDKRAPGSRRRARDRARDNVGAAADSRYTRDYSRSASPVPRRRRRKPDETQAHRANPRVPAQPRVEGLYPHHGMGSHYQQPSQGEPNHVRWQGEQANQYFPQTYRTPVPEDVRYRDALYDRDGRFVQYAQASHSQHYPQYDSQPRPTLPPEASTRAEPPAREPSVPDYPQKPYSFNEAPKFNFTNAESIFAEFMRGNRNDSDDFGMGGLPGKGQEGKAQSSSQTRNMEVTIVEKPLAISLEEIFKGTTKKLKIKRKTYDQVTGKTSTQERILEVPIKRGLRAGSKIKFSDVGDQVEGGTQDLHFILSDKPHPLFRREGNDIHQTLKLTFLESLCGWQRTVSSIDGKQVAVASSGPTGPTWKEVFPGLGMPKSKAPTERGDMVIEVTFDFPTSLTQNQKRMLKDALA